MAELLKSNDDHSYEKVIKSKLLGNIKVHSSWNYDEIKKSLRAIKGWFDDLEKQGVLFLNTAFTCKIDESNYHKRYWKPFTEKIIEYIITTKKTKYTWLLWGKDAKSIVKNIEEKHTNINTNKYECCHPRLYRFVELPNGLKETSKETDKENGINWLGTEYFLRSKM